MHIHNELLNMRIKVLFLRRMKWLSLDILISYGIVIVHSCII